jgi:hypothetical protein
MAAAALACIIVPYLAGTFARTHDLQWQHLVRNKNYFVGAAPGAIYVGRFFTPADSRPPSANETAMLETGYGSSGGFSFFTWDHDIGFSYVSPKKNDIYDPRKVSQYRRWIIFDRKIMALEPLPFSLFLSLLPTVFVLKTLRRFFRLRRQPNPAHCRVCGYDLRATPNRCPECGTEAARRGDGTCVPAV